VALARALGVSLSHLHFVAKHADQMYRRAREIRKADGSVRVTYDAFKPLKDIQGRIRDRFLGRVVYPTYLQGCLKGRDPKSNASLHLGARIAIGEDIKTFFDTIREELVFDVWQHLFGFGGEPARCLTRLGVKDGVVPQGACTSPHLANLVLWREEPAVYGHFKKQGIQYSRYVDDIEVSSRHALTREEQRSAIATIYAMLKRHNTGPKRQKHEILASGHRMVVTKLIINRRVALPGSKRKAIRAAVHQYETMTWAPETTLTGAPRVWKKTMGRVGEVKRYHPREGTALQKRLRAAKNSAQLVMIRGPRQ